MSDYDTVCKGKLKLKNSSVEKKKNSKIKKKIKIAIEETQNMDEVCLPRKKTAAEIAFEKAKEKRALNEMIKKASKSHKERIQEFNKKLEDLSEYNDVPKISWTK